MSTLATPFAILQPDLAKLYDLAAQAAQATLQLPEQTDTTQSQANANTQIAGGLNAY